MNIEINGERRLDDWLPARWNGCVTRVDVQLIIVPFKGRRGRHVASHKLRSVSITDQLAIDNRPPQWP